MRNWFLSSIGMLDNFLDDVRKAASEGLKDGPVTIEVKRKKESRSDQQNRLYRIWCRFFAQNSNRYMDVWDDEIHQYVKQKMDEDAWHDLFRYAYLPSRLASIPAQYVNDDKPITILQSTTRLTVQQMNEYMQKIESLAARMGMTLPIPDGPYREFRDAA